MSNTLFSVSSMIYQNKLRLHSDALTRATERLATGSRINNAKDDPFRNYEAKNATAEIGNMEKARQNSSDGAALLQIAEGTCSEVQNILLRIKELSVQSANDSLTSAERHYLNDEASSLLKEIDRIAAGSTFNSKQIFGTKGDSFTGDQGYGVLHIGSSVSHTRSSYKYQDSLLYVGDPSKNPGQYHDSNQIKVSIPELSAETLGLNILSLTYQGGATKAIDDLDSAITSLSTIRSYMGSLVNRVERHIDDLEERKITSNDHVSKIKDTDFAKESTALLTAQIQQQAATAILAQSNSRVSRVLEILGR
ncbi:MAG: hypothetical protein FWC26_01200 [Fibromonadales bacterium]|nr:hypothetical protein [Fibromonadales bacterium]